MTKSFSTRSPERGDHAFFLGLAEVPGVEILKARFSSHSFSAHSHDAWAFGAVSAGAQDFSPRSGTKHVARAGQLTVIPPGEIHAGHIVGFAACEYATLYIPDALLRSFADNAELPMLDTGIQVVADSIISAQFTQFVTTAAAVTVTELSLHFAWNMLLERLLRLFGALRIRKPAESLRAPELTRSMQLLQRNWAHSLTLNELAAAAQMSPAYFCRQFSKAYGLSPHRFQIVLRERSAYANAGIQCGCIHGATQRFNPRIKLIHTRIGS
ncbi:AraC family transcriptional regulator [bacterium]|nr:MAG: AraC family transcriptional regulator [bacterium]